MTVDVSFLGGAAQQRADEEEEEGRKYYGLYSAEVINPADPLMQGRVQVRMKSFDPLDLQAWARIVTPMAGMFHGMYFVPTPGDEVMVAFENGDLHSPCVVGSVHNFRNLPPLPSPIPQIRAIRTPLGNQLVFTEVPTPSVTLQSGPTPPEVLPSPPSPTAPYSSVTLMPSGAITASPGVVVQIGATAVSLQSGASTITLSPAGISITGPVVSIKAGTVLIN